MTASTSLQRLADGEAAGSFSNRMRSQRFRLFDGLVADLPRPIRILDIGGTNEFWEQRGWADRADVEITLLNLFEEPQLHANIISTVGDATDLADHADKSFDVAVPLGCMDGILAGGPRLSTASPPRSAPQPPTAAARC